MKFAYLTTINSLNEISSLGDIEFCLLPYCKKYFEYFNYYKEQSMKGKYLIADNTIAENKDKISDYEMVKWATKVKASEIIVPDVIGNYKETKRKREEFLKKYYDVLSQHQIFIQSVIQGSTLEEYEDCLQEVMDDYRIRVIAIPFRMCYAQLKDLTKEENCMMNRFLFIQSHKFNKPIHLLGCNLVKEPLLYLKDNRIRSQDTKLISRLALSNQKINFKDKIKPKKKLYIENKMNKKQINLAVNNIFKFKEEVNKYGK